MQSERKDFVVMWSRVNASLGAAVITFATLPLQVLVARDEISEIAPYVLVIFWPLTVFGVIFFASLLAQRLWNSRPYSRDVERFKSYRPMLEDLTSEFVKIGDSEPRQLPARILAETASLRIIFGELDIQCPVVDARFVPQWQDLVTWTTFLAMMRGLSIVGNLKEARRISRRLNTATSCRKEATA